MAIEQRMEHLERTNRRWIRLACTMAVLVVAAVGIGTAQMNEDELVLRNIVIQDEKGRKRIELFIDGDKAIITHLDVNGKKPIINGMSPNVGAMIYQMDGIGWAPASLQSSHHQHAAVDRCRL